MIYNNRLFKLHDLGYIKSRKIFKNDQEINNIKYNLLKYNEFKNSIISTDLNYYKFNLVIYLNDIVVTNNHKNSMGYEILHNNLWFNYNNYSFLITSRVLENHFKYMLNKYSIIKINKLVMLQNEYLSYNDALKLRLKSIERLIYLIENRYVKLKYKYKNKKLYLIILVPKKYLKFLFNIYHIFKD